MDDANRNSPSVPLKKRRMRLTTFKKLYNSLRFLPGIVEIFPRPTQSALASSPLIKSNPYAHIYYVGRTIIETCPDSLKITSTSISGRVLNVFNRDPLNC
jgi:hypothetical protein